MTTNNLTGKWWGSREKQPVIAVHGWQDNAGTFDNLAPYLCHEISLLCIDLPGHGLSSHYGDGSFYYIFWDGILILRRVVKHFGWEKVKILGHSLGGAIAFLYAATYPKEVESYISIDIASPTVRDPVKMVSSIGDAVDKFLKYETLTQENMPCYTFSEMIDIVHDAYAGSVTRENCEVLMKRGMKPADKEGYYYFTRDPRLKVAALGFMTIDQVVEFASRITCKVMNIRGDPGMAFPNPENYTRVLDVIEQKAHKLVRLKIPGSHHLHLNDPENLADQVLDFLKH